MDSAGRIPDIVDRVREALRLNSRAHDEIWKRRDYLDRTALVAQEGDRDARNALWIVVRPRLEKIALALGVEFDDVADLVQDVLLCADRNLHKFDAAKGSFRTWLVTILGHLKHNLSRSKIRRARLLEAMRGNLVRRGAAGSRADLDRLESSIELSRLLSTLSWRQREVLILYRIGDLTSRETGAVLGISAQTVRSIARDARSRLTTRRR